MANTKTVMVRLLLDIDPSTSDEAIIQLLRPDLGLIADRMWIAVDHPRPEDSAKLWQAIASGVDPHAAGSKRK